ncbi:MAG: VPGUxxT family thioredoxin-like (seleno)protein, type 2 [Verrucomicrobiota bacterium]
MRNGLLILLLAAGVVSCSADPKQAIETGKVEWMRDLDAALENSQRSGKPVFALFQEVPGCAGCKQFGREVLSHPLIVDAIESEFVPLLIHNNQPGKDAELLKRFNEPAWNYQVVRFLDHQGKDLIPRKDKVWTTGPLAERMIQTLEKSGREVPGYLSLLAAEESSSLRSAAFGIFCFWTGEMKLGQIKGVITTEAGFIKGREVTLVRYDPRVISLHELIDQAVSIDCSDSIHVPASELGSLARQGRKLSALEGYRAAPERDQKKQLSRLRLGGLDLTPAQRTKLNAWLPVDRNRALSFLSPAQAEKFPS